MHGVERKGETAKSAFSISDDRQAEDNTLDIILACDIRDSMKVRKKGRKKIPGLGPAKPRRKNG